MSEKMRFVKLVNEVVLAGVRHSAGEVVEVEETLAKQIILKRLALPVGERSERELITRGD
jgi:hypothetical protein